MAKKQQTDTESKRVRADDPRPSSPVRDGKAFAAALAEHDPKKPAPTDRELAEIIRSYLAAENEETRLELALRAIREQKSQIARSWVVRRGSAANVICRGETWSVQSTRWGAFCFRRYSAPGTLLTIELEDEPREPRRLPVKERAPAPKAARRR